MSVQICCGQMTMTWHFKPQASAATRMAVATSLDKLMHFECVAENCTPDIAFGHLMRQAVQHHEPLGLNIAAHRPVVLDVTPGSYAHKRWNLKPNTQIVGIDGRDVRNNTSAEIATMLSQHPRPTAVTSMAVSPVQWKIPHRDDPSNEVEIQVFEDSNNIANAAEIVRALRAVDPSLVDYLRTSAGDKIHPQGTSLWDRAMLCFHGPNLPIQCGSC